ncbi:MAG: hypothetical protein IPP14_07890 [Planctomycetes bacterium]|nr:hypothetical protein [Planctomycetota bacterium]
MRAMFLLAIGLLLAACVSTTETPAELLPPAPDRQSELTRLYDRLALLDASIADAAATTCAQGDDRDRRFLSSLWGTRPKNASAARRFGKALSATSHHEESLQWLERAYAETPASDDNLGWLRLEMAEQYLALGKRDEAINLLGNRLGATPLPAELQKKYDELIERASRS